MDGYDEEIEQMLKNPVEVINYTDVDDTERQKINDFLDMNSKKVRVTLRKVAGKEIAVLGAELRIATGGFDLYTPDYVIHASQWNGRKITAESIPFEEDGSIYCNRSGGGRYLYVFHEPLKMKVTLSRAMGVFPKYEFEVLK